VQLDQAGIGFAASNSLTRLLCLLREKPQDHEILDRTNVLTSLFAAMPLSVNYWHAQNIYYSILNTAFPALAGNHTADSQVWQARFLALGEKLQISVPALEPEVQLELAG
jgi:hypothetical protein